MTAKEMFEALGYKYKRYYSQIIVAKGNQLNERSFVFDLDEKTYTPTLMEELDDNEYRPLPIIATEHQAITQQMKELGWIE
jgi:hypothetical protein